MLKRLFDIISSLTFLILLSPLFLILWVAIVLESKGGALFQQERIGRGMKPFNLLKFRSMTVTQEQKSLITLGDQDSRITKVGAFLRKYKMDELPQLLNVLAGEMSVVGPRPEVSRYTNLYTAEQKGVFEVRPGLTDYASLEYINEAELLGASSDPEKTYVDEIMPKKLEMNLRYVKEQSFVGDLSLILKTLIKIFL